MQPIPIVLLVDDFENNLEVIEVYLKKVYDNHIVIHKAKTGVEALACFEKHVIDLVLLDVMLPDMDGFFLCHTMKEKRGDDYLPIVMLTALHDKESLLEGLSAGADDFLTKPVNPEELMIRVRNLVNLRMANKELQRKYELLTQEMHLARELLNDFMPKYSPVIEGVTFDTIYEPSSILGGDFYDIFCISEGFYGFFMSDVKGHGTAAAMIVALIKEKLHFLRSQWLKPECVIKRLNQIMCSFFENIRDDYFMTAIYAVFDFKAKKLTWCSAGHTPIAYFSKMGFRELRQHGLPLGIIKDVGYESSQQSFQDGEAFVFYTDGIFELPLFLKEDEHFSSLSESKLALFDARRLIKDIRNNINPSALKDDVNVVGMFVGG